MKYKYSQYVHDLSSVLHFIKATINKYFMITLFAQENFGETCFRQW